VDLGLQDRVVIITGSGRGIGAESARILAREGARLVITDLDADSALATADAMRRDGYEAIGVGSDVLKADDAKAVAALAMETYGRIDVLVNNAALARDKSLLKMEEADFDVVIGTTLKGAFNFCRAVLPHMYQRRWGRVINMSSRSMFGNPGQTNHAAAKAGIVGFTRSLSLEQARNGITVNALAPGFVVTEGARALHTFEELAQTAIARTPVGFLGEPKDIGGVIAFLASDHARYITGTTIFVTGGRFSS
jgi:3-oxoacyl-[acyl-carrier protein] reductase